MKKAKQNVCSCIQCCGAMWWEMEKSEEGRYNNKSASTLRMHTIGCYCNKNHVCLLAIGLQYVDLRAEELSVFVVGEKKWGSCETRRQHHNFLESNSLSSDYFGHFLSRKWYLSDGLDGLDADHQSLSTLFHVISPCKNTFLSSRYDNQSRSWFKLHKLALLWF